jgi:hypothetical protein
MDIVDSIVMAGAAAAETAAYLEAGRTLSGKLEVPGEVSVELEVAHV